MQRFASSREHLLAELERLDLLIRAQVTHVRKLQAADEQFRGFYISEEEVDALLQQPIGRPYWLCTDQGLSDQLASTLNRISHQIELRKQQALLEGVELRLDRLQELFQLDQFEIDALLICIAVELDLRYERLYAYLQDNVNKNKPSIDLVLNLLCPTAESKLEARRYFSPSAPLVRHRLLELSHDPSRPDPPLLAKYLKTDHRIAEYLLGYDELDDRIRPYVTKVDPQRALDETRSMDSEVQRGLSKLARAMATSEQIIVHLKGPYGVGKQSTAEAVCHAQRLRLLVINLERLVSTGEGLNEKALILINREARLQGAALYWQGFDTLLGEQNRGLFSTFLCGLKDCPNLTFLAGETSWEPAGALGTASFIGVELPRPTLAARSRIWAAVLNGSRAIDPKLEVGLLATKFKFTRGQIQDAAATAENLARWRDPENTRVTLKDLYEACRLHSNQKLSLLARKITPKYTWEDIVLPPNRFEQLREICNHMKYRGRVYDEWGFDEKLSLGKGLSVLFAGPSGTGKTMAADIIAGELGLDLYKIDLSTVVSKYIGETEKNLSRIFSEAETSNSILFFDEADALFGKRS